LFILAVVEETVPVIPTTWKAEVRRSRSKGSPGKSTRTKSEKTKNVKSKSAGGMVQVGECFPEALSSIPSITKRQKRR
jgi:hypothetical protein